jgi:transcriptional regulator with XRE-family HTH domain
MQDTQDVNQDYEAFLGQVANQIKTLRKERGLTLRDMVVIHGYHDSNYRRMEREGIGGVQSLLRICKAFNVELCDLLNFRDHPQKEPKAPTEKTSVHVAENPSKRKSKK